MESKSYKGGANFQLNSHHFIQASFFLSLAQSVSQVLEITGTFFHWCPWTDVSKGP